MSQQVIGIKVAATADTSQVEAKMTSLGRTIADANQVQFSPIGKTALSDVAAMEKRLHEMLRVSRELNRRVNETGQKNTPFTEWNWQRMYPGSEGARNRAQANAYQHVSGTQFGPSTIPLPPGMRPPGAPPPPPRNPRDGQWKRFGGEVGHGVLNSAGPVGQVVSSGISAGIGGGIGFGLAQMAFAAVGKVVSAISERVEHAEKQNVDYDRLKRTLGDVGVSFKGLKTEVMGTANGLRLTFDETNKLGTQFAKLANLSGDQYKTIQGELNTGVGLSRSFGLDPEKGVGALGQVREVGVTRNTDDSKRFAILVGETIGRSGAFAKADEVMSALASYAVQQTRQSLTPANVGGYAGMLSAMAGSGIAGLDVQGSAALLGRVNASLTGGGAKGEASQFFTAKVGNDMGLDPYRLKLMREGGAFSTNDQTFGKGSVYQRYTGDKNGPSGGKTYLQSSLDRLRATYKDPMQLADATANHLGIGMNQAMALLNIKPDQMGELQKNVDLSKMTGNGIGNLVKAKFGTAGERQSLAGDFLSRKGSSAISAADAKDIRGALGDDGKLKEVLSKIAANYDQQETTGSLARDSKNALENIKDAMADKMIPLTQGIRDATMFLAGDRGKMSPEKVREAVARSESSDRVDGINATYADKFGAARSNKEKRKKEDDQAQKEYRDGWAKMTPEERVTKGKALAERMLASANASRYEINGLNDDKNAALGKESDSLNATLAGLRSPTSALADAAEQRGKLGGKSAGSTYSPLDKSTGNELFEAAAKAENMSPQAKAAAWAIYQQESRGGKNSKTSNRGAVGGMQILPATFSENADKGWDIKDPEQNLRAGMRILKKNLKRAGGNLRTAVGAYYSGPGTINADGSLATRSDPHNPNSPNNQQYADQVMRRIGTMAPGELDVGAAGGGRGYVNPKVSFDQIHVNVNVKSDGKATVEQPDPINVRQSAPTSSGGPKYMQP